MGKNPNDANTEDESSTSSNVDANNETENLAAGSSAAETPAEGSETTVDQVIDNVLAASRPASEDGADSEVRSSNQTPPKDGEAGQPGKEAAAVAPVAKVDDEGKEIPPFHEHPRWKEMVSERNELKEWRKTVEPIVQQYQQMDAFRQEYNITGEQMSALLEVGALLNTDPVKALSRLKPLVEQLGQLEGSTLPPDLQNEVDEGVISTERAQEIAKLRAQSKLGETRSQVSAQRQQAMYVQTVQQNLQAWEQNVMKTDPDFKPKSNPNEPDGKYEMVIDKARAMWSMNPPRSPQEAVTQAQQAYEQVQKAIGRYIPAKPPVKSLGVKSASPTVKGEPESVEDVMNQVMAKHGLA